MSSLSTHYMVIEDIRDAVSGRMLFHHDLGFINELRLGARIVDGFEFVEVKATRTHDVVQRSRIGGGVMLVCRVCGARDVKAGEPCP